MNEVLAQPEILELVDQIVHLDPFRSVPTVCGALGVRDLGVFDPLAGRLGSVDSVEASDAERAEYVRVTLLCAERALAIGQTMAPAPSTVQ